jgi:Domain of unknown function (DUF222)/HNH endonuclease
MAWRGFGAGGRGGAGVIGASAQAAGRRMPARAPAIPSSRTVNISNMCSTLHPEIEKADHAGELGTMPLERLEREITELAAHINAATCNWLSLVGEFDRREGWAEWDCASCVHWLSYRCGLSPTAARDQVRVARLLQGLPAIRAAFGRGELSYSQVRALTRVATAETEGDLIAIARYATAAQLERIVRAYRGVLRDHLDTYERRYLRCHHDEDGSLLIRARLPAEEGALVMAALEAGRGALREGRASSADGAGATTAADGGHDGATTDGSDSAEATHIGDGGGAGRVDGDDAPGESPRVSNADALVLMAQTLLSSGAAERATADSYQVVVHVDAATLAHDDDGPCQLEQGTALHPETARRLACDASLVRILERDGRPLSVGRKTRAVPAALRRALKSRDPSCRFPGCDRRRFLHAHHLDHWARGGRTDLSNLVHLCSQHHRLLHEGGYRIERGSQSALRFRRPDGRLVPTAPARPSGEQTEVRRRNGDRGLNVTHETCVPEIYGDRLDLHWVVDELIESDRRFR